MAVCIDFEMYKINTTQTHLLFVINLLKDKQQKGDFNIDGYTVKMNNTLRKDSKKDCCFEVSAPDKRVYQVDVISDGLLISASPHMYKQ